MIGRIARGAVLGIMLLNALWFLRNIAWLFDVEKAIAMNVDIPEFAGPVLVIGRVIILVMVGLDYLIAFISIVIKQFKYARFAMFGAMLLIVGYIVEMLFWYTRHSVVLEEFALWGVFALINAAIGWWYEQNGPELVEERQVYTYPGDE